MYNIKRIKKKSKKKSKNCHTQSANDIVTKYTGSKPNIGDKVTVIIKPYNLNNYKTGIIKRVLTNKLIHTRGHKVMLDNNIVGRCVR